tara:strand:- start:871 stop:1326 length:456 start_codon:yes stop_codon:yes gene_type:complete
MAHRKTKPCILQQEDFDNLISTVSDQIMAGASSATYFIIPSISGTIDEFTEEVSFHTADTQMNASGIIGAVVEEDMLLVAQGQVKVGDVKVSYPYAAVSGILGFGGVDQIVLLGSANGGVSGVYSITGRWIDVIGDQPIFVDYALAVDKNG